MIGYRNGVIGGIGYDGSFTTSSDVGDTPVFDQCTIGGYKKGDIDFFNGKICEIIIQTHYDATELSNTLTYLIDKWGL